MGDTNIDWAEKAWNPVTGCTPVSEGCANCYAEKMARRNAGRNGYPEQPHHFDVTLHEDRLLQPLRWKKARRIFVNSMSDTFHPDVPDEFIARLWTIMAFTSDPNFTRHEYIVLTKRPDRMLEFTELIYSGSDESQRLIREALYWLQSTDGEQSLWAKVSKPKLCPMHPLPNVTLMVTAENQARADERIPVLLKCPAARRGVSIEPQVGAITLNYLHYDDVVEIDALNGTHGVLRPHGGKNAKLDWVIVGGETGPGARPMHPDWVRSLRDQCAKAGVPFFLKQWGEWKPMTKEECEGRHFGHGNQLCVMWPTGMRGSSILGDPEDAWEKGCRPFERAGKKAAGYLLDGVEHREFPEGMK